MPVAETFTFADAAGVSLSDVARLDEAALRAGLDRCLLTDAEWALPPSRWARLADPLAP